MKGKLVNIVRVVAASIVLLMATFGYICYEKTLVVWWLPILFSFLLSLLTFPLFSGCWQRMAGTKGIVTLFCHFYAVGGTCYFLLLGSNYFWADSSSGWKEEVYILEKENVVKTISSRSGRRYRNVHRTVHYYYLTVRFIDGTCKQVPVSLSVYNRARENGTYIFNMQRGLFGFRVIK